MPRGHPPVQLLIPPPYVKIGVGFGSGPIVGDAQRLIGLDSDAVPHKNAQKSDWEA